MWRLVIATLLALQCAAFAPTPIGALQQVSLVAMHDEMFEGTTLSVDVDTMHLEIEAGQWSRCLRFWAANGDTVPVHITLTMGDIAGHVTLDWVITDSRTSAIAHVMQDEQSRFSGVLTFAPRLCEQ